MAGLGSGRAARVGNGAVFVAVLVVLGALVGCATWLFLLLMQALIKALWHGLPTLLGIDASGLLPFWFVLALTVVGALILALFERRSQVEIVPLMQVMACIKKGERCEYRGRVGQYFTAALLPLAFGSAVGPEAGLTNVVTALCTWVGDAIKALAFLCAQAADGGRMVRPRELAAAVFKEGCPARPLSGWRKRAAYAAAIAGGVVAYQVLSTVVGGGLTLPRLPAVVWSWGAAVWAVPCLAAGVLLAVAYCACDKAAERLGARVAAHPVARNLGVALVLSAAASCTPFALFSGESDLDALVAAVPALGAGMVAAVALCRCVCTPLCIHCGWRGGQFFPLIFAGVAGGYAMGLFVGIDPVFSTAFVSAAMLGVVMRKPIAAALLMVLVMPFEAVPLLLVAAWVGSAVPLPRAWGVLPAKRRKPARRSA